MKRGKQKEKVLPRYYFMKWEKKKVLPRYYFMKKRKMSKHFLGTIS